MMSSVRASGWLLAAAVLAATAAGCGRTQPASPAPAGSGWSVSIQPLPPPAGASSFAPQLTHSARGVLLSWLERAGPMTALKFSERTSDGWSATRTAASGTNWFASWADAPSVLRLSNGTIVGNWFVNTRTEVEGYDLFLTRSSDEGRTWSPPFKPNKDHTQTQHGFPSMFEMPDKGFGIVWLDARDQENNTTDPEGGVMTLRFTSFDPAWKQSDDVVVNARVCECCQTAAAVTPSGVLTAFRDRSEREIRDIAVSRLDHGYWTGAQIVHADNWEVDSCPVNGPALSASGSRAAVAWFTMQDNVGHAYAAFSDDAGTRWSAPIRLDEKQSVGYVDVEMLEDGSAVATWVEFADQRRHFRMRHIDPSGAASAPIDIAGASGGRLSGYPRVSRHGDELVFAWTESAAAAEEGEDGAGQQVKGAIARLPRTTAP